MTLAWLGANVIKVEPPAGDQSRAASSDEPGVDSHYFMLLNANKQSVTCNLKHEQGREMLRRLIAKSDVLVENFAPGVIERLGFSYEEVSKINPRIVYAQIKGFAPDGPYANYLSFDMIAQATGGAMSINGERDGRPLRAGVTVGDTGAGLHCVIGILAALYQRQFTGRGQRIEVVMQEVVTNFARIAFASNALFGEPAVRNGNASVLGSTAPSEAYPCKGGGPSDYCFIYSTRAGSRHWERLLEFMGRSDLAEDQRFSTPRARYQNREAIDELISEWTRQHDKRSVMKMLGEAGIPAGAVFDTAELASDPEMHRRGVMVTVQHKKRGAFTMPGWPVKMSDSNVTVTASPLLGENTDDICQTFLNYDPGDVREMREQKAI
jgi:formyl-CoA transferase